MTPVCLTTLSYPERTVSAARPDIHRRYTLLLTVLHKFPIGPLLHQLPISDAVQDKLIFISTVIILSPFVDLLIQAFHNLFLLSRRHFPLPKGLDHIPRPATVMLFWRDTLAAAHAIGLEQSHRGHTWHIQDGEHQLDGRLDGRLIGD